MQQPLIMKLEFSSQINPFGGINFVFEHFDRIGFADLLQQDFPQLAMQCTYDWKDLIYSLFSIYFCGGDCIEDIGLHLKSKIGGNPFCAIPSPDRILDRLKELGCSSGFWKARKYNTIHQFSANPFLCKVNIKLLKKLGVFDEDELTIDYDNTIIATEKADCKPSYKSGLGYNPGIATINIDNILYVENRDGNSGPIAYQHETLKRMFSLLEDQGIDQITNFRADSASYQNEVFKVVNKYVDNFYISAGSSQISERLKSIDKWEEMIDNKSVKWLVGETVHTPFFKKIKAPEREKYLKTYRLIVKKKLRKDGQIDLYTSEPYEYFGILTNNKEKTAIEVVKFYHQRGAMEKQFDIMKNDFGWQHLPFSKLEQNTVFLILMGMCKNIYQHIIREFSKRIAGLQPNMRIKKFIFRFITIPAKWIYRSRQKRLKVFSKIAFKV